MSGVISKSPNMNSGVVGAPPTGHVIQFQQKSLFNSWTTTSSTYASTELTIDFTPKYATSKLIVQFFGSTHANFNNHGKGQVRKNGAVLSTANELYSGDDLLDYFEGTEARGHLEGGFWTGTAGSTATATYAYYVSTATGTFYLYRNTGIWMMEIRQ